MAELTMEEKAKLFNFGIALKELAKKYSFCMVETKYSAGINIDEWEGKISCNFMTSECAKREKAEQDAIIEVA